ncbi:MAG: PAS domain S-box-containing protein [Enterobacterales bacterium]|jgi:PAS domain S-box-containing protein
MNETSKLIEAQYYPRLLNHYWIIGKVRLVSFIAISIAILFLTSVTQVHASADTAQAGLPHQTQKEILIVGSEQDYPPFATGMTDAYAGGFTVELWKAVADEAGLSYTIRVNPFRDVLQNFKDGKTDVLINLARSEERDQFADFTVPHVIVRGAVFVRKGESSIRSMDDLVGKSIIVLNADLAHDYALTKGWKQQLVLVDTTAEGFRLLASGKHDAILIGKLPGMQTVLNLGLSDIKVLKFKVGFAQKFGFAVHEGQSDLLAKINEGLAITKANGTYDVLYQKWFGIYEVKDVGFQDLLKYIIPIILFFLGVGGYFLYQRHVERKQAEEQLQEIEERTRLALDASTDGVWDWNIKTGEVIFSDKWCRSLGYEPNEVTNDVNFWLETLHPDDKEKTLKAVNDHFEGKTQAFVYENRLKKKSGNYRDNIDRGQVFEWDEDGKPLRMIGTDTDITEQKQLQSQLQHSQKLDSLGVLSGGIAHNFNNILSIIIGYCGLTKMNFETAEKNIPIIEKAAEQAAALSRQMMAYAGKEKASMSKFNIGKEVDETASMLKATLPQNAVIKTELSAKNLMIKGNPSQLHQLVMNLIINASEAIGTEQGEVNVSLAKLEVIASKTFEDYNGKPIISGQYVCLEVTDNGCGMDETTKSKIFEPFYTTKFTGRGLGMSAVLGIINSHGGAIQLFSQLGQGTTFKVYLPALVDELRGSSDEGSSTSKAAWQGSGTILLAEDEEQVRFIAKELLEMFGFTVLEAINGKEALELYQTNAEDITLVLTDIGMPIMDGYALVDELKKLNPELPIIISSGFGDAEVKARIRSDNIAGIARKPYDSDKLRAVLKSVVNSK